MILTVTDNTGDPCPSCGTFLDIQATYECDGAPYPDQELPCPKCGKKLYIEQRIITILTEVT